MHVFRFSSVQLPTVLVRLQRRSAADAETFLAALSSDTPGTAPAATALVPPSSSKPGQANERGISNLPAWMVQEGGSSASAQTECAGARSPSPPPSMGVKVPPPKVLETVNNSPAAQSTAAGQATVDRSGDRVGERGLSLLPAWMVQEGASAAGSNQGASSAALSAAPLAPPSSEIKIPVPKTAVEAAASFPLLSLAAAAGAKRDRIDEADSGGVGGKRPRQSSAAAMFQEVAMLLQDAEVEAGGDQQRLEVLISSVVKSGDGVRNVSDRVRVGIQVRQNSLARYYQLALFTSHSFLLISFFQAISAILQVALCLEAARIFNAYHPIYFAPD